MSMPTLGATGIWPVIIDMPSDGRAIVTVRNDHAREVLYQVNVMNWHVVNGEDRYEPTQDFIASPPLFMLAPHASKVVRIGFRSSVIQPKERAYRLVLAEVPHSGDVPAASSVVSFAVQYLLPVFVASSDPASQPSLTWSLRTEGDVLVARATNTGARRIALNTVGLSIGTEAASAPEFISYQRVTVLAKSWREWRFTLPVDKIGLPWGVVFMRSGSDAAVRVPSADTRPLTGR